MREAWTEQVAKRGVISGGFPNIHSHQCWAIYTEVTGAWWQLATATKNRFEMKMLRKQVYDLASAKLRCSHRALVWAEMIKRSLLGQNTLTAWFLFINGSGPWRRGQKKGAWNWNTRCRGTGRNKKPHNDEIKILHYRTTVTFNVTIITFCTISSVLWKEPKTHISATDIMLKDVKHVDTIWSAVLKYLMLMYVYIKI